MTSNWAFHDLNQLVDYSATDASDATTTTTTTTTSAVGGSYGLDLLSDYPSAALNAQLETWSNLTFDFEDFDHAGGAAYAFEEKVSADEGVGRNDVGGSSNAGHLHDYHHHHDGPSSQAYGLSNTDQQARQFQALLLESSSSVSTLDPSLSLALPLSLISSPMLPSGSLPSSSLNPSAAFYGGALDGIRVLPDFSSLPSLPGQTSSRASTSSAPSLIHGHSDTTSSSSSASPSSQSTSAGSATAKKGSNKKIKLSTKAATAAAAAAAAMMAAAVTEDEEEIGERSREGSVAVNELDEEASVEDKRKRNTAASARFRIKKKQREAALEDSAKEMRDRVASLEEELKTMKTENNWLRGLIMNVPAATSSAAVITSQKPVVSHTAGKTE